ncbi:hypothetical protein [Blastopirellula retiformator]|uniref:ArnR1-like winged helix-turn-helix domain-containing protein n=1 Tax=Blastopirellula retiformator TaxID=2527970 RepID=A0A5C5V7V7_9BACT|nr:hypothetical protein [Blastopirellula retiformator]TWT34361.1 hypothetical protein Enr8_17680 [Blastopirellula retiformator]
MSQSEQSVLKTFRKFYMSPGKMLCFTSVELDAKKSAFDSLVDKRYLMREKFAGAYSLTSRGYRRMQQFA